MKDQWMKDFQEFSDIKTNSVQVPPTLFKQIQGRIFPNPWKVFGKILGLQVVVGFLSLAFCTQFGLNPFSIERSLSDWFMKTGGHSVCMVFCGIFFIATPYLLSNFLLNLEELEAIRKVQWLQVGILSFASLGAFYFFGGEIILGFALLWGIGAFIGGLLSIESSYLLRRSFVGSLR